MKVVGEKAMLPFLNDVDKIKMDKVVFYNLLQFYLMQ
jgi:hypothetical protein